ncbi:hypothetical protein CRG98_004219 [Punica granatum]|uniref:G-patch domain-containing protein n=1 Tax=Punica granatum TaxID=22663 RepID=A0A2I0L429_PUNGR|nr:hypothetical protein CRG98_004219 [Punica granatum]
MARGQRFEEYAAKWRAQGAKHIHPISEEQQIQLFHSTLRGVYYSHLLAHTSSFFDLIEAEKKLDLGIKLGKMEDPASKGEESSKKAPMAPSPSGGRRAKEVSPSQPRPPVSRAPPPAQQNPTSHGQQAGGTQSLPRKQYSPLPAPLSHIYRQLLAGNQIQPISPGPNFDPSVQDQSKHCEYHQGAPGHTLDNCWRDEEAQENPLPFVINYTPEELIVGFTGHVASPAPFVVNIPAREPYSDSKVPWTYEGSVGSVEQQFSVMGVTHSGRVYESPAAKDKGKAPAVEVGATPESSPFPSKKVTEEEAEAFMKIVKASEYKVVEQMAKSSAHISLLALLLGSEPHREALLRDKLITVKGEEDYAIYKETAVPYISVGDDENLPFHSFETISVIRDYGESGPSRADRMIGKVLLRNNYIPGTGLGARGQGISRPIEVEGYKRRRGLGFRPSCHEIIEARKGNHLHHLAAYYGRLNKGTSVPPLSRFFPGPSHTIGGTLDGPSSDSDDTPATPSAVCTITEEIPLGVHIRLAQENEELDNWTSIPRYSAVIADVLHSNPNPRCFNSNISREQLSESQPVYFGEGLPEDNQVPEIEERLRCLEDHQITSVEPTEEINDSWSVRAVSRWTRIKSRRSKSFPRRQRSERNAAMEWDHECQKAFDTIKAYLIQPPILVPPVPNRPLILYLTVRRQSLGCMLGQEDEPTSTKRAIYYLSKKFTEGESNYPEIEQMCCALVKELEVFGDSMLTIFQTLGQWKTKDAKLISYHEYLEELAKNFEKISFTYTPRTKNQLADALATLASMASIFRGEHCRTSRNRSSQGPSPLQRD